MSRIKLQLPERFTFSTQLPVRITDINYGGHLGNNSVLSLLHEARMQYLKYHGYSELEIDGVSLIMSDVAIEFKAEAYYGEVLTAFVGATDFTRSGFDIYYRLIKNIGDKELVVAQAKTGMVCFNYSSKKVVAVPDGVLQKLTEL